jgi:DNA invertase Pin-like site-specific DNA recombinase
MQVAAYVRVSSHSQDAGMQQEAIRRAARARGDELAAWYVEKQTGSTMRRPELERLRADARAGHIAKLYVFRLDRLTRTGIRDTLDVLEELRGNGCVVTTLADGFDLHGPMSEFIVAGIAWGAKMERLAIGERIQAARARVEANGGNWGHPKRMSRREVERARELAAEGKSVRVIAVALKVPKSTIARAIQRPTKVLPRRGQKPAPARPLAKASR